MKRRRLVVLVWSLVFLGLMTSSPSCSHSAKAAVAEETLDTKKELSEIRQALRELRQLLGSPPQAPTSHGETVHTFPHHQAVRELLEQHGPKEALDRLKNSLSNSASCHQVAHALGRVMYEMYESKAFSLCTPDCHSGCYHGAIEAYFRDHGTANLAQDVQVLCHRDLNRFFSHQCFHGIGHGLMAWANYEIVDALEGCDLLLDHQDSCYTGVFMENIVGGLAHGRRGYTKYLSPDPHFPCTMVAEKYRSSCYSYQTSRMLRLFHGNFDKVAQACSEAPVRFQHACFLSMGRDVGGMFRGDPVGAIRECGHAPVGQARGDCLAGAVQDSFWDPGGQESALTFCRLLDQGRDKGRCYQVIAQRASQVLTSPEEREDFCGKMEPGFENSCQK